MNWNKLKEMKCPEDGEPLNNSPLAEFYDCTKCSFKISAAKFDKIVNDMYQPKARRCATFDETGNLADWNNYGHEKMSEDYSDRL